MMTENVTRHRSGVALAFALALAAATSGCASKNPPSGSTAYKSGTLGNGDFLFACDDGAACLPYSGDAKRFPELIATGSTFDVRFVANDEQGSYNKHDGITTDGVTPNTRRGPQGLTALHPGLGTIIAYDNAGNVVDYTTITIVQPKSLAVYDSNYTIAAGKEPPRVETIDMRVDAMKGYRVLAEANASDSSGGQALAGSIPVSWTSSNPKVVKVDSYSAGVANLVAVGEGTAVVTVDGAGIKRDIAVMVQK